MNLRERSAYTFEDVIPEPFLYCILTYCQSITAQQKIKYKNAHLFFASASLNSEK